MQNYFNLSELYDGKKKGEVLKIIDDQFKYIFEGRYSPMEDSFTKRKSELVQIYIEGEGEYDLTRSKLLASMILLYPFLTHDVNINSSFIPFIGEKAEDNYVFHSGEVGKYMDHLIKEFSYQLDYNYFESLNEAISESFDLLRYYSGYINVASGHTMSLFTLYELINKIPEDESNVLKELLTSEIKLDKVQQIKETEDHLAEQNETLMDILKRYDNDYRPYLMGMAGVNPKQFGQTFIGVGYKPDLDENIIPEPIVGNYVNGLKNVQDYYISAIGTAKALITNFNKVEDSGYLTRKSTILNIDTDLDTETHDCGTPNFVNAKITDEVVLERLRGRVYYHEEDDEYYVIEPEETKYLIGETIKLRSPVTCASKKGVCALCYGEHLAVVNQDRHTGLIAVLAFTRILTQLLLSSKHLLQAKSVHIDLGEDFNRFFILDRDTVLINPNKEEYKKFHISIKSDDLHLDDEKPGQYFINKFTMKSNRGDEELEIKSPFNLNLFDKTKKILDDNIDSEGDYQIPLRRITGEQGLFFMVINNIGLSSSLQAVLDLIDKKDHLGLRTIDDIYNKFIELLSLNDIKLNSVHVEMIMYNLIRDINDIHKRPDFSQPIEDTDYTVLSVPSAIMNSDSISVSLSFEDVERQLWHPDSYKKEGKSNLDYFFIE